MHRKNKKVIGTFLQLLSYCNFNVSSADMPLEIAKWHEVFSLARSHNVLPLIFEKVSENESFTALMEYQQIAFETMSLVAGQARRTEAFLTIHSQLIKSDIHPIVI